MTGKLNIDIVSEGYVALAVSGGPDSIAMLHMMYENDVKFVVLTVNHNLRENSLKEAKYVGEICKKLGIKHEILNWEHDGVISNVHDRARDARYNLMTKWCSENNVDTLCTAHHMDDRVEHFLIRVYRGAGLLGLIDHQKILYNGIMIVRPMFDFTKQELLSYLDKRKISYVNDESNLDSKYLRTNIRKWLQSMPIEIDQELFRKRVIGVKENLARAVELVNRIFEEEMEKVEYLPNKEAIIHDIPRDEEVAIMMLSYILPEISGEKDTPRMDSMKRLYSKLTQNNTSKTTLCGCIIEKKRGKIFISKENRR